VGGCVAAGLAGPRRAAVGGVRDFVLGARIIDGRGEVLRFGGEVMKNVAGYDVSRVLAGSLGTLGLILEVSLKVLPRPWPRRHCASRWTKPRLCISSMPGVVNPCRSRPARGAAVCSICGLSGAAAAAVQRSPGWVARAYRPMVAEALWAGLRDQT
jgi:glycolate oxidase FAD binding subunit